MKRQIKQLGYAFFTLFYILGFLTAAAMGATGETGDQTLAPYFFIENKNAATDNFPLKKTDVSATINGVIAEVTISQQYTNTGERPLHGRYIFPASTRAAVHGMTMTIGQRIITAKIKERRAAQQSFAAAKKEGKSASLLAQQRPNVFRMDVANIMPGDTITMTLHYTELLVPRAGTYAFVFPTVVGPRYAGQSEAAARPIDRWVKNPFLPAGTPNTADFRIGVQITSGIPVADIACPSHRIETIWDSKKSARVRLAESEKNGGNRDFILTYRLSGQKIQSGLMLYKGPTDHFFLMMVEPPRRVLPDDLPRREYIFVLDVSGSMHGFPLNTSKILLKRLISHLNPDDRFNLLFFAGGSRLLAPASLAATSENIDKAVALIDQASGGGGTELHNALQRALSLPRSEAVARSVLIITDGYISAEADVFRLIQSHLNQTSVFTFGIGSSVNRYLIEGMARAGQGASFIVTDPARAPQAADRFRQYVAAPVLTHIRIGFDGFAAFGVEPANVPDLFASRPIIVFGKWRGRPEGKIRITGITGSGPFQQTVSVAQTLPDAANSALPYLWARKRIARLSDFGSPEDAERQAEVTSLGLTYNLLTRYTAFVAIDETIRNPLADATDTVKQPLPLPLHVSNLAVGGMSAVPEPDLFWLLMAAGLPLLIWRTMRQKNPGRTDRQ